MRKIGVSVLTNEKRNEKLQRCLESLLAWCSYRPLVIGLYDNGSTDETLKWMKSLPQMEGIEWRIGHSPIDEGCAVGTNKSINLVADCELHLHLESDFELLHPKHSGMDVEWLHRAVELLNSGDADYLYLRRMRNELESKAHWWSRWIPRVTEAQGEFLRCPGFWWSNNPALFKVKAMYDIGVLPLNEKIDGPKGTAGWSMPELNTKNPKHAWLHRWGVFVHEAYHSDNFLATGCGSYGTFGYSGCKYGFWKNGKDKWCQVCDRTKDFRDLAEHEERISTGKPAPKSQKAVYADYHANTSANFGQETWLGIQVLESYPNIESIMDFGCGTGYAVKKFKELGVRRVYGYEYSETAFNRFLKDDDCFFNDLRQMAGLNPDVLYSTEVFEHIPESRLPMVLSLISACMPKHIFATISLRPSSDDNAYHVTLKPRVWWDALFDRYGFEVDQVVIDRYQKRDGGTTKEILSVYRNLGPKAQAFCDDPPYELNGETQFWYFAYRRKS